MARTVKDSVVAATMLIARLQRNCVEMDAVRRVKSPDIPDLTVDELFG
jgi:hypothetical protein